MSKAVKKVSKSVSKVFKGAAKIVKKVTSSKIFKIAAVAATVYFGGAMLMGAAGGASAGTGFLGTIQGAIQGAGAGLTNAMNGISGAWGAITGGEGLGAAASSLGGGVTGAYGAGQGAVAGVANAAGAVAGAAPGSAESLMVNAGTREAGTGVITNTAGSPINAGKGLLSQASAPVAPKAPVSGTGSKFDSMSFEEFTKQAPKMTGQELQEAAKVFGDDAVSKAISQKSGGLLSSPWTVYGATQLAGGAMQGYAQDKAAEEERERYNKNIGGFMYERRYA